MSNSKLKKSKQKLESRLSVISFTISSSVSALKWLRLQLAVSSSVCLRVRYFYLACMLLRGNHSYLFALAGIGLIPYMTVAGFAAAAGGGMVALRVRTQYKRPQDSRLILACESMNDAVAWKLALEHQILKLDNKPQLPACLDPQVISNIVGVSTVGGGCRVVEVFGGMRVLEQTEPLEGTRCLKAQTVVPCLAFDAFLQLMEDSAWPINGGSLKVCDHAKLHSGSMSDSMLYN